MKTSHNNIFQFLENYYCLSFHKIIFHIQSLVFSLFLVEQYQLRKLPKILNTNLDMFQGQLRQHEP